MLALMQSIHAEHKEAYGSHHIVRSFAARRNGWCD